MNKRAMAILLISSLGFLVAVLIFYAGIGTRQPGPESPYLGHNSILIFNAYYEAESRLLYIDESARLSWKKSNNDLGKFKEEFQKYLGNFNARYGSDLSISDYEFFSKDGYLKGRSSKELHLDSNFISYSYKPNFRVYIGDVLLAEETVQSQQPESVSLI